MEPKRCPVCEGKGEHGKDFYPDGTTRCKACFGLGYVIVGAPVQYVPYPVPQPYPVYPPVYPQPIWPRYPVITTTGTQMPKPTYTVTSILTGQASTTVGMPVLDAVSRVGIGRV